MVIPLLVVACSGSPPVIRQVYFQRNYKFGSGNSVFHTLSVSLNVDDPDGKGDIDSIYIINDELELFWKIDQSRWLEKNISSNTWLGTNDLVMPSNKDFPQGKYRAVIIDKGGERDKVEFYIPAPVPNPVRPDIKYTNSGDFLVESLYKENYLWLQDSKGITVKRLKIVPGKIAKELVLKNVKVKVEKVILYSFDPINLSGYYSSISFKN